MTHLDQNVPAPYEAPHEALQIDRQQLRVVRLLLDRFRLVRGDIAQLLKVDRRFRQLVEEYEACSDAVDRLDDQNIDGELRDHYAEVRMQVENELIGYLASHGHAVNDR